MADGKKSGSGIHRVSPHLVVNGGAAAIDFYVKALGAKEVRRYSMPGSNAVMYADLELGDTHFQLSDEMAGSGCGAPAVAGNTSVVLNVMADDADAVVNRAVQAGAKVIMPVAEQFWGDRYGQIVDPFGHRWAISSHSRQLTEQQIAEGAAKVFGGAK